MTELNTPLTLYGSVTNITESAWWSNSDGDGDPYVGLAYQWTITVHIQPQSTGSWVNGYQYTESNVQVGNWIIMASAMPSTALEIVSIISTGGGFLTCIVEDVDRYNLMLTSISGINPVSADDVYDAVIVSLGSDGLAIFSEIVPYSIPITVQEETQSRLRYRNYLQDNYRVYQENNTFSIGNEIMLNSDGTYSLATASGAGALNIVGQINSIGIPGDGWFTFEPVGKIINNISPNLPGNPGSIIYADPNNPGLLTATPPTSGVIIPLYIQINVTTGIQLIGEITGVLNNLNGIIGPTLINDSTQGYSWGSIWVNIVTSQAWICVNPTAGGAVWTLLGSSSGGSITGPTGPQGNVGIQGPTGPVGIANAAGTIGEIQFNGGSNILSADTNLYWDNLNKRVGVGTQTPLATIHFGAVMLEYTASSTNDTTPIVIDSFPVTDMRSAHYYAQITDEDRSIYQVSQITVIQNGLNAYSTEYNILAPSGNLGTFGTAVSSGNCVLLFTASSSTNKTMKVSRSAIGI